MLRCLQIDEQIASIWGKTSAGELKPADLLAGKYCGYEPDQRSRLERPSTSDAGAYSRHQRCNYPPPTRGRPRCHHQVIRATRCCGPSLRSAEPVRPPVACWYKLENLSGGCCATDRALNQSSAERHTPSAINRVAGRLRLFSTRPLTGISDGHQRPTSVPFAHLGAHRPHDHRAMNRAPHRPLAPVPGRSLSAQRDHQGQTIEATLTMIFCHIDNARLRIMDDRLSSKATP